MDFRIRQLQCFLTLSELLNFNKTARARYMTQPAITFQIKSLEEAFGVKLFERDRAGVRLTDAGFAFREFAQTMVDTADAALEHIGGLESRHKLSISCGPVAQFLLLPALLRSLFAQHPEFRLEVNELTTEQQMTRLLAGEVDALLMVPPLPGSGIRFDPICEEPLAAVVALDSPLAKRGRISVEELRGHSLIASRPRDCRFHQPFLRALLAPYRIKPQFIDSSHSSSVHFAYAAAGEGIAMTTASMARCSFPGIAIIPFEEEDLPQMQLGLITLESNDRRAIKIFRNVVRQCASNIFAEKTAQDRPEPMPGEHPVEQCRPAIYGEQLAKLGPLH
jgi:DNA-binding transcriptional LysR family regulator